MTLPVFVPEMALLGSGSLAPKMRYKGYLASKRGQFEATAKAEANAADGRDSPWRFRFLFEAGMKRAKNLWNLPPL